MGFKARLLFRLLCLLLHVQALLALETVSEFGEDWPHTCVQNCLGRWPIEYSNVGSELKCDEPFYNDCYCATAAASASKASSFLEACASTACRGGDFTLDLSAMESIYASYCMANGFTQPGATKWYNPATATQGLGPDSTHGPAPGATQQTGPASTTTRLSVVTQTTTSGSLADSSSQPWVATVDFTSTVWVNSAGSVVAAATPSSTSSSTNNLAVDLGVGVTALLALAAAGTAGWICLRRRRMRSRQQQHPQPLGPGSPNDPLVPAMGDVPAPAPSPPIPRKAVAAVATKPPSPLSPEPKTWELGGGQGVRRELGGRELHPFPDVTPRPPVAVPGQHELHGAGRRPEMPCQTRSPPPRYYHVVRNSGASAGRERWELPGN
ncbi:8049aa51-6cc6-40de-a7a3-41659fb3d695 [Thermothielavioides terrestris]|uniref:8049aa51-6cc6-40de-a7a3-41659fb3d695 n=1 Tax=Thermothielavioides terrestris TaxID=2587410 RepID=A0A3S4EX98_9PEZI|nr:8049aa51-6cc6-40de-a7a3-41659fb3d695 [Thermothielavioides terrestris]